MSLERFCKTCNLKLNSYNKTDHCGAHYRAAHDLGYYCYHLKKVITDARYQKVRRERNRLKRLEAACIQPNMQAQEVCGTNPGLA